MTQTLRYNILSSAVLFVATTGILQATSPIIHDAEYNILAAQNAEKWSKEDKGIDEKLAALRKKHGKAPNIIHIMWDDM